MAHRVCPWWLGYFLINPFRRWRQNPARLLSSYVREGMAVLEPGPGMGFFTIDLLRLVGKSGRVTAVDIQPRMLTKLKKRANKAGVEQQLDGRLAKAESMDIADLRGSVDFTLAFAVVHEFPDPARFFSEVAAASKSGALLLFAEPAGHVKRDAFNAEVKAAEAQGFQVVERPEIRGSQTVVMRRG